MHPLERNTYVSTTLPSWWNKDFAYGFGAASVFFICGIVTGFVPWMGLWRWLFELGESGYLFTRWIIGM